MSSRMPFVFAAATLSMLACGPSRPLRSSLEAADASRSASRALHELFAAEWEYELAEHPIRASELGDGRNADAWDDVSLAAEERRAAHERQLLERLLQVSTSALNHEDALSYELFLHKVQAAVAAQSFRFYLLPINQRGGIQTADELADTLAFQKPKHFADYNKRLERFPKYVDDTIELLEAGIAARTTHPAVIMKRVSAQIESQIPSEPKNSPFYAPYRKAAGTSSENIARDFAAEAERMIVERVIPAFRKLQGFWRDRYLPACTDKVGIWQFADGERRYEHLVAFHTTTKLTPAEVHDIGQREVQRIRSEMEIVKERLGFKGPLKDLFATMRQDKKFYFDNKSDLLSAYRELAKRIDPMLVTLFKKLPRTPYGVSPIPDNIAPDTTTAYYREPAADGSRAGTFFVNLYRPETRPKWEMPALTLHESVPGHHLQIALATEQDNLPAFRRHAEYTAFVEGWALYAESLGDDLGLYQDPYAKLGQLMYEMWRAVRLVVDTGIHHQRWTRDQAIAFFLENTAKSELDVVNEVDRYIVWPGQALAYKIGELRIKALRRKQEATLGARFDLREFHDAVLRQGPLPLDVLERELGRSH